MHTDLPPRMVCRTLKSGKRLFYYNGRKRIPLGSDLNQARIEWAKIENNGMPGALKFATVAADYERLIIPTLRSSTQREYRRAIKNLCNAFVEFTIDNIRPADVKDYMRMRGKVAAIREKATLASMLQWARDCGLIDTPNPCNGVGFTKHERQNMGIVAKDKRYVTDEEYREVWEKAPPVVQDVMDLCLLTGQRLGDVLRWTRQSVKDGVLTLRQSKTGADVGIRVEGELRAVLERIQGRPRAIQTMYLVADEKGQRLAYWQINYAFTRARGNADWTIRDLRRKAAKDSPDLATARGLLGHSNEQTTAQIYRPKSTIVGPLK